MTPEQVIESFKALSLSEKVKVAIIDDLLIWKEGWWLFLIICGVGLVLVCKWDNVDYFFRIIWRYFFRALWRYGVKLFRKVERYFHNESQKRRMEIIKVMSGRYKLGPHMTRSGAPYVGSLVQAQVYELFGGELGKDSLIEITRNATPAQIRTAHFFLRRYIAIMKGERDDV